MKPAPTNRLKMQTTILGVVLGAVFFVLALANPVFLFALLPMPLIHYFRPKKPTSAQGWTALLASTSASTVLGALGTVAPLLLLLLFGAVFLGIDAVQGFIDPASASLIGAVLSALLGVGMLWPTHLLIQATEPQTRARRWIRWMGAFPVALCILGPTTAFAIHAALSAIAPSHDPETALLLGQLVVVSSTVCGTVSVGLMSALMMVTTAQAEYLASLKAQPVAAGKLRAQLDEHGLVLEDDPTLPWLADGEAQGVPVRLLINEQQVPYRLRIEVGIPGLPEAFQLTARGRRTDGKIGDVILDGAFHTSGLAPAQARALLADLQAPLMAMHGESVHFEIRDGQLVVEQHVSEAYRTLALGGRLPALDDAIETAGRIAQRARQPAQNTAAQRAQHRLRER